jgi:ubiquinone/menaquinone biosynthesis C-methylase UbiE
MIGIAIGVFMIDKQLLENLLRVYAFQPATALWRAIEIDVFRKYLPSSGTILDLGCGDGKLTTLLFEKIPTNNFTLVGIDSDAEETTQAANCLIYTRVHTCNASSIPELSTSFDHVISNSVLEHIEDIQATLKEVTRLLKPGGLFTFSVPSAGFHVSLRGPLLPGASRQAYLKDLDNRLAHYRYWTLNEWNDFLEKIGLRIVHQVEYLTYAETRRWETISRFTAGILYVLNGKKDSPLIVQRKIGLRQIQNRLRLPAWLAHMIAILLSLWIKDSNAGNTCLLIQAKTFDKKTENSN